MNSRAFMLIPAAAAALALSACGGGSGSTTSPPPPTYTIGGMVSGLTGTGLLLEDNGVANLSVSANGSFTFATPIASGGTYNVTVFKQPSNPLQDCVVTDGSGTANGNVTSVQVTCTVVAIYTIGGMVSGLTGTGLVLQDNGGDNLPVNANGSFTFATPIASGRTYNVTVYLEPTNEVCVVSNGSGTADADVTNVQITCSSSEQVLYSFGNKPDGNNPVGNLVFGSSGNLYGTTVQGGSSGNGTVFKLTPNNGVWSEAVLYSFCPQVAPCDDGAAPSSNLVLDAAGNLYGTTVEGGLYGYGVVFELAPDQGGAWTETVLHSFGNATDGSGPSGGVVFDSGGNLFGTTYGGGTGTDIAVCPGGCGTLFELSPGANGQWTEKVLYEFCSQANCADGSNPSGGLIFDAAGNLYGTTQWGGTPEQHLNGTVFELTPGESGQWTETVLYMFQGEYSDGQNPLGGVVQDKSGNLYGTTEFGYTESGNNGVVFKLTRGAGGLWTENVIHGFCSQLNCLDGSQPLAGLVIDKAGNLYGTAFTGGGPDWGVVFEITEQGGGLLDTVLYSFEGGTDGFNPHAGLILDAAGNLYGVAISGGLYGYGVVFEVTP